MVDKQTIDTLWIVITAALVFLMQAGFACLESGLTRAKNTINVAIKNLTDFGISAVLFWAFGYGLMFGLSHSGIVGFSDFFPALNGGQWLTAFFLFELVFCSTSTTIISGAVAERMRFLAYIIVAAVVSGLIYPVYGHWAWGGLDKGIPAGWLARLGFRDFAGSSVVHSLAGWVSLAALFILGPRQGRFLPDGTIRKIHGHDIPVSVLGVFLLWFGWLGFNGGSTLALNDRVAHIITNTILAGASGMVATLFIGWGIVGRPNIEFVLNGSLAGCVAITAPCNFVNPLSALLIGAIGGLAMLATDRILECLRIDDAVGAIPVHLGAGIWGTLAVGLFGDSQLINTGLKPLQQLGIQALGAAACGVWTFGVSFILFKILNRFIRFRVTAEEEFKGLNVSEHGATTELLDFLEILEEQAKTGDISRRILVEPFTEVGQIAKRYNNVMDTLEKSRRELQDAYDKLRQTHSQLIQSAKMAAVGQLSGGIAHEINNPLTGILNNVQLIKMELEQKKDVNYSEFKKLLDIVEDSALRCKKISSSLLDFSHASAGIFQPVSVNEAIEKVAALTERELTSENIALRMRIEQNLPLVHGDAQLLQQVIFDLIANSKWAIKKKPISEKEEKAITITGAYDAAQRRILIDVSDTGIGIPEENLAKLFQPFFTTKPIGEGTGLGLSIVSRIIKEHRGTIEVESRVNQGTTFKISLPIAS